MKYFMAVFSKTKRFKLQRISIKEPNLTSPSEKDLLLYPSNLKLKQVQIIHRHGQRAPIHQNFLSAAATPTAFSVGSLDWQKLCQHSATIMHFNLPNDHGHYILDYRAHWLQNSASNPKNDDFSRSSISYAIPLATTQSPCYPGELSVEGQKTLFNWGARWRQLYVDRLGLVDPTYSPSQIFARSTEVPRALQSLQSLLLGLYPNKYRRVAESQAVIPIVTVRETREYIYPSTKCARWVALTRHFKHAVREAEVGERQSLFSVLPSISHLVGDEYLADMKVTPSNKPVENVRFSPHSLYDDVISRIAHKLYVPAEFFSENVLARFSKLMVSEYFAPYRQSKELIRLGIGRFVNELLERIEESTKDAGVEDYPKLLLYSAHDSTLAPLLALYDVFDMQWPAFASNVAIEVFEAENTRDYFVRMKYNDQPIKIPGCQEAIAAFLETNKNERSTHLGDGTMCPLWKFKKISESVVPKDYVSECNVSAGTLQE